jgi:hypothetical protein
VVQLGFGFTAFLNRVVTLAPGRSERISDGADGFRSTRAVFGLSPGLFRGRLVDWEASMVKKIIP